MPGPKLNVAITVLPDGQVVFGDLPADLAEVALILAGAPGPDKPPWGAHDAGEPAQLPSQPDRRDTDQPVDSPDRPRQV